MSSRLQNLADALVDGATGAEVVQRIREEGCTNEALLNSIYIVRGLVICSKNVRNMHPRRDETLDTLLALADKDGVGDDCRRQAQAFADGTLQEQLSTQNEYKRLAFFPGHLELDDAMRGVRLLNDNMNDFHASTQENLDFRRRGQERIDYKNTHMITIPGASAYLRRAEAILRGGEGAYKTPPMSTLLFALLLVTGRRITEILNVRSEFHEGSNGNEMSAIFGGQLKKRKKTNRVAFEIPLLVTFNLFRQGLDALRARQGTWDEAKAVFTPLDLTDKQVSQLHRNCNMSRTLSHDFFEGATATAVGLSAVIG